MSNTLNIFKHLCPVVEIIRYLVITRCSFLSYQIITNIQHQYFAVLELFATKMKHSRIYGMLMLFPFILIVKDIYIYIFLLFLESTLSIGIIQ